MDCEIARDFEVIEFTMDEFHGVRYIIMGINFGL